MKKLLLISNPSVLGKNLENILKQNYDTDFISTVPKQIGSIPFNSYNEYSCAMKSHFRKIGNQMSGSGNHLCEFTRVMFYLDRIPLASICHVQDQCL